MKYTKSLITIYTLVAIITFGHVWNRPWTEQLKNSEGLLLVSATASAAWPFYWSVIAWE